MKFSNSVVKLAVVVGCWGAVSTVSHAAPDSKMSAAPKMSATKMSSNNGMMMNNSRQMRMKNAQMLIQTLSEEKTEINTLTAQRAAFLRMGGAENKRIATMYGRWIAEHKAGGPKFMNLIRANGGNPMAAKILKSPVLGSREKMMTATHKDHEAAVATSKMRRNMTNDMAIKNAMTMRMNLASKHIREMAPYHSMMHKGMNHKM